MMRSSYVCVFLVFSVQFSKCCFDNFLKHVWTSRHIKRFWHYSVMNFNVFITLVNSLNSFSVFSWSFRYIPGSGRQEPLLTWQHSNLRSVCWAVTDCWQFGADTRVSGHVSRPGQHGRHLSFRRILAKIEVFALIRAFSWLKASWHKIGTPTKIVSICANQPAHHLWSLCCRPNFMSTCIVSQTWKH